MERDQTPLDDERAEPQPYGKHSGFIIRQQEPFNGGPEPSLLRRRFITPTELFYVRNHGAVPHIDPDGYRLSVDGLVQRRLELSLDDLRTHFPKHTLAATLQCAGNRREALNSIEPIPGEVPWGDEAISNAVWAGALLRDVLLAAGIDDEGQHVAFTGLDSVERHGQHQIYGGSLPLAKALAAEVLVAYEMNGAALAPVHGYPLRIVAPGYIGARSVKWLATIAVLADPSPNYFQTQAYKLFPPYVRAASVDASAGLALGEFPVNAAICTPREGAQVPAGATSIEGYAIAGGGRAIARVDVSADGGASWTSAELQQESPWAWTFWSAVVELQPGPRQLVARAWDSAANSQPEHLHSVWNFKGYLNNAWHRVSIQVEPQR